MKYKNKRKICASILMIFIISAIFFSIKGNVYANNTQNNTNVSVNNNSNNTTQNTSNTNASTSQTTQNSSNANLSNLGIRPHDFTGFRYGVTTYDVTVPESTKSVEVYATAQDSKASITGTGLKQLENGKNVATVEVTAQDGTTKTYTINIIRGNESQENTSNSEVTSGNGLSNLEISGIELSPEFETNVYEYKTKYIGEATQLDVKTQTTDDSYVVEVIGNEQLKEGENIITILVSQSNGDNVATYQVIVDKSLVDEEAIAKEAEQRKQFLIIGSIIIVAIIVIIVFIIIRKKRNERFAQEYSGVPFSSINDEEDEEDYDEYEEEKPKALKNKKTKRFEDEEELEEQSKEKLREQYLNNFGSDESDYDEERQKRTKKRGKRFK